MLANGWNLFLIVSRLEERESEMKKEYNALHQRHTEVGYHLIISEQTLSLPIKSCQKIHLYHSELELLNLEEHQVYLKRG